MINATKKVIIDKHKKKRKEWRREERRKKFVIEVYSLFFPQKLIKKKTGSNPDFAHRPVFRHVD